jgi:hypothetical protein
MTEIEAPSKPEAMTPAERSLRSRIGAHALHASGKTNTGPAREAFRSKFELEVDPDGVLPPEVRAKRAEHARKAHMTRLALASAKARRGA